MIVMTAIMMTAIGAIHSSWANGCAPMDTLSRLPYAPRSDQPGRCVCHSLKLPKLFLTRSSNNYIFCYNHVDKCSCCCCCCCLSYHLAFHTDLTHDKVLRMRIYDRTQSQRIQHLIVQRFRGRGRGGKSGRRVEHPIPDEDKHLLLLDEQFELQQEEQFKMVLVQLQLHRQE